LTERLYRDDPYLLEFDAAVVSRREHQGRPAVVLDRTAFYAEGGGQPSDQGVLGEVAVLGVIEEGGEVLHVLDAPIAGERVRGRVDSDRRRDHRQQHHGQHLLSRAFVLTAGAGTVGFHLGAEHCTIDLDREVGDEQVRAAETLANEVVGDARPVAVRTVSRGEAVALGVAPPEGAGDSVRLVEAAGFDVQPCGGTHPRSTAEVGVVIVLGRERHKGGSRVRFVCGHRARAAVRGRNAILDRLCALLSASPEALPEAAARVLESLAAANRRSADLLGRALDGEARRLLAGSAAHPAGAERASTVVVATYDAWPPADLRALGQRLVALAPCVALLGSRSDAAYLVFAQTDGLGHDIPALLRTAVETVGGRGGGKGNLAQGGGDRLDRLREALDAAAAAVRARG
jgi:alanyl-tRNA synthetase